jgi:hypothetical protein
MTYQPVVTTSQARELTVPRSDNPHLIWDGTTTRVIPGSWYRRHAGYAGWLLIMTRDELADIRNDMPDLYGWDDPAVVAIRLTDYAGDEVAMTDPS